MKEVREVSISHLYIEENLRHHALLLLFHGETQLLDSNAIDIQRIHYMECAFSFRGILFSLSFVSITRVESPNENSARRVTNFKACLSRNKRGCDPRTANFAEPTLSRRLKHLKWI
jgi:hypothetical protein